MVFGGIAFAHNLQFFKEQGFVAIGMPLIIFFLGVVYFFRAKRVHLVTLPPRWPAHRPYPVKATQGRQC
jgi:hypothetical protein